MFAEGKRKVLEYARKRGKFTIPELQEEYSFNYVEALELVRALSEASCVELSEDGTYYKLTDDGGKTSRPSGREPLGKERLERPSTSPPSPQKPKPIDPFNMQLDKTKALRWGALRALRRGLMPEREGDKDVLKFGVCYPDDSEYVFTLEERGETLVLHDEGLTAAYLRKKLQPALSEETVTERIRAVIGEYNITLEEERLETVIKDAEDVVPTLFFFFSAIERLSKTEA